jgi:drug/metabolite transporter (DMT)-like permease
MMLSRRAVGIAACAVTVLIWVGFIVVARAMAHRTLTPFDIGFVRFVAAALVLVPWGRHIVRRRRALDPGDVQPPGAWLGVSPLDFRRSALVGLSGGVGYSCLAYSGFYFAPASHASVLMPGMLPLWTAALAWALLGTRVSPRRAVGLSLIALAALLVGGSSIARELGHGTVWLGDLLFLAASLCWSTYTVLARRYGLGAIEATVALSVFAFVAYVPAYAVLAASGAIPSRLHLAPWSEIVLQGFMQGILSVAVSGIAFVRMVETYGPVRSTMITSMVPPLSALGAVALLGEPLQWTLAVGLCLATAGIVFGVKGGAAPAGKLSELRQADPEPGRSTP